GRRAPSPLGSLFHMAAAVLWTLQLRRKCNARITEQTSPQAHARGQGGNRSTPIRRPRVLSHSYCSPSDPQNPIVFGSLLAHWERQTCNMGKHLSHSSPAAEIEAEQLVGAFRRGAPHPPTDEQTGNQGHRDLQVHPIFTVTEQMATPQETFNPAEEQ